VAEKERLNVLCTLAACVAVTNMTDSHLTRKKIHLRFIENFGHKSVTLDSMERAVRSYCYNAASLLASVLKCMQTIVSKACCILNTIDSKNTTLVMELVIPI
jgi:hypothetical protein